VRNGAYCVSHMPTALAKHLSDSNGVIGLPDKSALEEASLLFKLRELEKEDL
jgi:hypothetical protein